MKAKYKHLPPLHSLFFLGLTILIFFGLSSCEKDISEFQNEPDGQQIYSKLPDGYLPTILGDKRDNPYNYRYMQEINTLLYGVSATIVEPTHYYIQIYPSSVEDVKILDTMNINVYDFPLDHELITLGDYYLHPGKTFDEPPIFYAVTPLDFSSLSGISYSILDTLHLRSEDESLIRKALEMKGYDPDEEGYAVGRPDPTWSPDPGGPTVSDPTFSTSPLVAVQSCYCKSGLHERNPAGCISVYDTQLSSQGNCATYRGVSFVKVILKDSWFTEDEVWTNRTGCFFIPGVKYTNKVWQWVKFTHSRGHVRGVRNGWVSIWDWMFIIKDKVGVRKLTNFNHLDVCYDPKIEEGSRDRHHWNAATVFNGLHEYYDFASRTGIGTPPEKLDMYIDRNDGGGVAYMFDKMTDKGPIWNNVFLSGAVTFNWCTGGNIWRKALCPFIQYLGPLTATIVTFMPDVKVGCGNFYSELPKSDRIKETTYHELGHAAHYQKLPSATRNYWWINHVGYVVHEGTSSNPYGDGSHNKAPKCAVVEMWGGHIGATIADKAYQLKSSGAVIQSGETQALWKYNHSGKSSYWWVLEDYDPNWTPDPSRWIPVGVLHDLMDDRIDEIEIVNDSVSGYTNQQLFNALESDVKSIPQYRQRLLQQNNNNQQSNVNALFQSYGY